MSILRFQFGQPINELRLSMQGNSFGAVILVSSLACLITTIGIITISRYEAWANENAVYFMSFAAGVLISVSFMHIIPKAFEMNTSAPLFLLIGFMGFYLINRFMQAYICHKYQCENYSFGLTPMLGIGLIYQSAGHTLFLVTPKLPRHKSLPHSESSKRYIPPRSKAHQLPHLNVSMLNQSWVDSVWHKPTSQAAF